MPRSKISAAFGILVLTEIAVITMSVRNFFNLVALLAQHDEFFLRALWGSLGLIEPSVGLPHILDSAGR